MANIAFVRTMTGVYYIYGTTLLERFRKPKSPDAVNTMVKDPPNWVGHWRLRYVNGFVVQAGGKFNNPRFKLDGSTNRSVSDGKSGPV